MAIINCLSSPTYENPRGFSIQFLFAKLGAYPRNEIIHNHVVLHYPEFELINYPTFRETANQ